MQERGGHQPEEVALEFRSNSFVPQGNIRVKNKGINTSPSTVNSAWVTTERLKREGRSLGCHPCDHVFSDKWDLPDSPTQVASTA
jgi:hypothetical protein